MDSGFFAQCQPFEHGNLNYFAAGFLTTDEKRKHSTKQVLKGR